MDIIMENCWKRFHLLERWHLSSIKLFTDNLTKNKSKQRKANINNTQPQNLENGSALLVQGLPGC